MRPQGTSVLFAALGLLILPAAADQAPGKKSQDQPKSKISITNEQHCYEYIDRNPDLAIQYHLLSTQLARSADRTVV